MKKITTLLFIIIAFGLNAQVLNEPANWPNANWTITGNYDSSPAAFLANPTNSTNFSYDDDELGAGSVINIAAESAIIDLTAPYNAGETWISVSASYVLNIYENETLSLQYWDADANNWLNWNNPYATNTTGAPNSNFCNGPFSSLNSEMLNISGFSANQLLNFKYRFYYNDNGSWGWGFCLSSPTISSATPPACPNITNLSVAGVTTSTAEISWVAGSDEMSWQVAIQSAGTGVPLGNGVQTSINAPYVVSNLDPSTNYEVYVRGNCTNGDNSNWIGPIFFSTMNIARLNFYPQTINVTGYDLAVVDMNGDFLDDIVGVSGTSVNIKRQNATGFTDVVISTPLADNLPSWSLAAADIDGNGKTDLLYGGGSGVTFMKANNEGDGFTEVSFSQPEYYVFSQRSNFVDINNDGHLDAFVCHDVEPNVYFINDGLNNFTFYQSNVTSGAPYSLGEFPSGGDYGSIWVDYDNDRDMDLFIAKCGGSVERRTNQMITNNNGVFTENAAALNLNDPMQTWSSTWADFDNDGDLDVFVGASSGNHKLMRNNGAPNFTFTDVTAGAGIIAPTGWESSSYDFDNDGFIDIACNGSILYGKGDLTFEDADDNQINYKNGAFGDLNNDGFIDAYYNGVIYFNGTNANNWVKINTIGTLSNKNGIGARVELHTNNGIQLREVRSGEGFEFMSSLNTHFGLGAETSIDKITIYWPSGTIDNVINPSINTSHTVVEGSTLSIDDEDRNQFTIYPNPVEDILQIELLTNSSANTTVSIFNVNGKRITDQNIDSNRIDVSKLETGVYLLRIKIDGKSSVKKFIKN